MVAPAFGEGMADIVLECRQQIALLALQAADVAGGKRADETRILAEGLFGAPPAGVASNVENRGQALMTTDRPCLFSDRPTDGFDQVGIPSRPVRERGGKKRRASSHEAG